MNNDEEWQDLPTLHNVAAVQIKDWEIEVRNPHDDWTTWNHSAWYADSEYRGRPAQPKKTTVALECWIHLPSGTTITRTAGDVYFRKDKDWHRFPEGDIKGEVEL